jgi:hypothetical protein
MDPEICLGCFYFRLEFEKFLIRKKDRSIWSLKAEEFMKEILVRFG